VSNYVQSTNFATKDALSSGDPLKIVKGTEINTEFNNIATAVATKADLASPTFTGTPALPTGTTAVTQSAGNNSTAISTTAYTDAAIAAAKQALYPVGSIYINATNSTNPGTLLGFGTWSAFGAGRVPVGFDAGDPLFDSAEETGGSKDAIVVSHTHTGTSGNQSADHTHTFSATTSNAGSHTHTQTNGTGGTSNTGTVGTRSNVGSFPDDQVTSTAGAHDHTVSGTTSTVSATHNHSFTTDATGSSGTNANLQPYITVYIWKRTA